MKEKIEKIRREVQEKIRLASKEERLDHIWREYLGRQDGILTVLLRQIKDVPEQERPLIGSLANQVKEGIERAIEVRKKQLAGTGQDKDKYFDPTLPGKKPEYGHLHPLTRVRAEVIDIFSSMGYEIWEGQQVEDDYHNFEALNIPKGHPARDMWDTFWLTAKDKQKSDLLLRTHTSPVQIRVMKSQQPPLRVCAVGRCFRHEDTDASHEHTLYQIEAFVVDKNITVANLIYTLKDFLKTLFQKDVRIQMRPAYFPFTEPSFEIDMECLNCGGKGCRVCSQTGWVELLGSGMIHPNVFKAVGYSKDYTGFAFGVGLDRLAMMKYQIDDIRWFHSGDLRFIRQF